MSKVYDDFNGPLSEQDDDPAMDAMDIAEAERRLADPNDKAVPFNAEELMNDEQEGGAK